MRAKTRVFNAGSGCPESGWEPFMRWLDEQGLDPTNVRSIAVDARGDWALVTEYRRRKGKRYIDPKTGEAALRQSRVVEIKSYPPTRDRELAQNRARERSTEGVGY